MKFSILGCGSIGKRHISNLLSLGEKEIIAYDIDATTIKEINEEYDIKTTDDYDSAIAYADAVLICTPNHLHSKNILDCQKNDKHIFVEKPMSHNLEDIDEIKQNIGKKIFMVGCNLRYHPLVNKIKKKIENGELGKVKSVYIEYGSYLVSWRQGDYRKNYSSQKKMGGGIILDDIHEINYAQYLFGKFDDVSCTSSKISDLDIDVEDNADMTIRSKDGFNINIHMDYLQKVPTRTIKIICENGVLMGDINNNKLSYYKEDWIHESQDFDYNKTYIEEIKDFIDCIKNGKTPTNSFEVGLYDLKVVDAAKKSSNTGRTQIIR